MFRSRKGPPIVKRGFNPLASVPDPEFSRDDVAFFDRFDRGFIWS